MWVIQVFQDERTADVLVIENKMVNMHHSYSSSSSSSSPSSLLRLLEILYWIFEARVAV